MGKKATTNNNVNKVLLNNFVKKNLCSYIGYIAMVMIAFPLQFLFVPRSATKFINNIQSKNWWEKGPLINSKHAEGAATIIIGSWVVISVCFLIRESIARYIVPKHTVHVRQEIYKALIERYEEEFNDIPTGNVITRLLSTSELYVYMTEWFMQDLIPYAIGIAIFIIYSWTVHRKVGVVVTIGMGATFLSIVLFLRKLIDASNQREAQLIGVSQEMNNSFSNLMNVYINNQVEQEVQHGENINTEYGNRWMNEMEIARNMNILTMTTTVVAFGIVILVLLHLVKMKKIRGIEVGTMIIIYLSILGWMQSLFLALPQSLKRLGSLENAMPFLNSIFTKSVSLRRKRVISNGKVTFKNVTFTYPGQKEPVFSGLSLVIKPGEKVAIIGRSGSGKTTIMKLLLQLYTEYSGTIMLDDVNVLDLDIRYLRQVVNYVNQRTVMHDIPIIDNIKYGNNVSEDEIVRVLQKYDLMVVFEDIPEGINAPAGIDGNNMSLGMQKCVVILRGLFRTGSKVIVFDEPIAGLDPKTADKIMRIIKDYTAGKTVIMITHNKKIENYVEYTIPLKQT